MSEEPEVTAPDVAARLRTQRLSSDPIVLVDALREAEAHMERAAGTADDALVQVERAGLMAQLGRNSEAQEELERIASHWRGSEASARALRELIEQQTTLAEGDELLRRFEDECATSTNPSMRGVLASARAHQVAVASVHASQSGEREGWRAVIARSEKTVLDHRDDAVHEARHAVATALLWGARGWREIADAADDASESTGAASEARALADALVSVCAGDDDPAMRALLATSERENEWAETDPERTLTLTSRMLSWEDAWEGTPEDFFARARVHQAWALRQRGDVQRAQDALDEVERRYGSSTEPAVQPSIAFAWAERAILAHRSGDSARYDNVIEHLLAWVDADPSRRSRATTETISRALDVHIDHLATRVPENEDDALSDAGEGVGGVQVVDAVAHEEVVDQHPTLIAYALAVYDFADRYADDESSGVRARVASHLYSLAHAQRMRFHFTAAEATYRRLWAAFADDSSPAIRETYAGSGALNLGFLLLTLTARPADALAVYDDALARFGDATSTALRPLVAKLRASRSAAVTLLHDSGISVSGLEEDTLGQEARDRIRADITRGNERTDAGDFDAAIAHYTAVIDAYPQPTGSDLRRRVCDAMVRRGYCINRTQRWLDSVAAHHALLAEFSGDVDMTIEKDVALALSNLASALDQLGRHDEELDAYTQIVTRWSDSTVPYLRNRCARAWWMKGYTEEDRGDSAAAEASYLAAMRYLTDDATDARVEAAKGGVNLAIFLRKNGRPADACTAAERVIAALGSHTDTAAREQLTKAYLALARGRALEGNVDAACDAYDWVLGPGSAHVSASLRATASEELLKVAGGPLKGAWRRLRRGRL